MALEGGNSLQLEFDHAVNDGVRVVDKGLFNPISQDHVAGNGLMAQQAGKPEQGGGFHLKVCDPIRTKPEMP
jgi:hypothetical protein